MKPVLAQVYIQINYDLLKLTLLLSHDSVQNPQETILTINCMRCVTQLKHASTRPWLNI